MNTSAFLRFGSSSILRPNHVARFCTAASPQSSETPQFFGISGRYAHALFNTASKSKQVPKVLEDVTRLRKLEKESTSFKSFLLDPTLPRTLKSSTLGELAKAMNLQPLTSQFLRVVADNGRVTDASQMFATFEQICMSGKGAITATVTSVDPLTEWQTALVKSKLAARFFPGKPDVDIQIINKIDESLLMGMTIQLADKFIDLSARKEMQKITELINKLA